MEPIYTKSGPFRSLKRGKRHIGRRQNNLRSIKTERLNSRTSVRTEGTRQNTLCFVFNHFQFTSRSPELMINFTLEFQKCMGNNKGNGRIFKFGTNRKAPRKGVQ